jgi:hypothetical protein
MDNDMAARRVNRLSSAGQEVLAEIRQAMEADDQEAIPALVERMGELPQADRVELAELIAAAEHGLEVERQRLEGEAEALEQARQIFRAAQDKLEAEGRPADPNMTVEEAYAILQD